MTRGYHGHRGNRQVWVLGIGTVLEMVAFFGTKTVLVLEDSVVLLLEG